MDVTRYLEPRTAPQAVLDALPERRTRPRFFVPAAGGDWRAVTWGAFAAEMRALGAWLASIGLEPGERAAIYAPNRVEWLSAALAIQAAGGVLVPIYPASTAEQLAYVVDHSDARVLFVDSEPLLANALAAWPSRLERLVLLDDALDPARTARALRERGIATPPLDERRIVRLADAVRAGASRDDETPGELDARLAGLALDQPSLMLYTSGTTGNPKGVPLTHGNVAHNGADWLRACGSAIPEHAVDLLWLPMSHIFGLGEACLGNLLGFTTYLVPPERLLGDLPVVRPDVLMSVPAVWEKIARAAMAVAPGDERRRRIAALTGGRLAFCLSGGAGLKREVKELFFECGLTILEGYGLTECSPTLTLNRPAGFRFDSVGKPLASVELRLAEDGEILARGPNVFAGYHKDAEATAAAFDDGWLKTGDVGRFTDDGFLQIVDRKKEILVTAGGKNVPPANIEQRFADDPMFQHVVVYGDGKKYLVAGVWLDPEAVDARVGAASGTERKQAIERLVAARIDAVNDKLARFEQIKRFRIMDTPLTVARGLLTSTLKVRRKHVYQAFGEDFEALYQEGP